MSDVSPNQFSSKSYSSKGTDKKWKSSRIIYLVCLVIIITIPLFVLVLVIIAGISSSLTSKLRAEVNRTSILHELELIQSKYFRILSLSGLITDGNSNLMKLIREYSMNSSLKDSTENKRIDFILNTALGRSKVFPAPSCQAIKMSYPTYKSNYYWVTTSSGSRRVYCDLTMVCGNITGGLTRVVVLNKETRPDICYREQFGFDRNGCVRNTEEAGCSHIVFPVLNAYSHICGTVESSIFGYPDAFNGKVRFPQITINDNYVDGISLTYGKAPNRTHIWTFAADRYDTCRQHPPSFVGNNFSCLKWLLCSTSSQSCTHSFYVKLPKPIKEDIELRLCRDQHRHNEGIYLGNLELYVR